MAIEIRQFIIKTIVEQKSTLQERRDNTEHLKTELLNQCKELINETVRRERER